MISATRPMSAAFESSRAPKRLIVEAIAIRTIAVPMTNHFDAFAPNKSATYGPAP